MNKLINCQFSHTNIYYKIYFVEIYYSPLKIPLNLLKIENIHYFQKLL